MSFQTPITVKDVLERIYRKEYLLPAIQREFVWNPGQIRRLLDSVMRGYPIGSFLMWRVEAQNASSYAFYDFLANYHERDHPYADKATVPHGQGVTAVLDGQQRLTALNVAIYGTHAEKKKYAWWSSTDAFPVKRLYLNLAADADAEELGLHYDLRFLTGGEVVGVLAPEAQVKEVVERHFAQRIVMGLAMFARDFARQCVDIPVQQFKELEHDPRALQRRGFAPGRLGSAGILDGLMHLVAGRKRDLGDLFAGCGVEYGQHPLGYCPLAIATSAHCGGERRPETLMFCCATAAQHHT